MHWFFCSQTPIQTEMEIEYGRIYYHLWLEICMQNALLKLFVRFAMQSTGGSDHAAFSFLLSSNHSKWSLNAKISQLIFIVCMSMWLRILFCCVWFFLWSCLNACQNICTRISNIATDRVIVYISSVRQIHLKNKNWNIHQTKRWEMKKLRSVEVPSPITVRHTEQTTVRVRWRKENDKLNDERKLKFEQWKVQIHHRHRHIALSFPHTVWTLAAVFTFSRKRIYLFIYSVRSSSFMFAMLRSRCRTYMNPFELHELIESHNNKLNWFLSDRNNKQCDGM